MLTDAVSSEPTSQVTRDDTRYVIRPFEPGDVDGFLSLYRTVWGVDREPDWFARTYVDIPYLDSVPVFVAEADGEIVGARPCTAFRMRAGDETALGLLTRDTMVHPDHRRRGIFTEMTEVALRSYEADAAFIFSHSNPKSLPGYRKLGWRPIRGRVAYYRVQSPGAFVATRTRERTARVASPVLSPLARGYLRVRDRSGGSTGNCSVTRYSSVPTGTFAALYDRRPPASLHPVRDEAFYDWRFDSPEWQPHRAYVARRDGEPIAGLVTKTGEGRLTWTSVVDVVPRAGDGAWRSAVASLIDHVLEDHPSADVIRVSEPTFPAGVLRERGFLPTDSLPLAAFMLESRRLTLAARPLGEGGLTVNGRSVVDASRELWSLAY